jgi:hypothetical protein
VPRSAAATTGVGGARVRGSAGQDAGVGWGLPRSELHEDGQQRLLHIFISYTELHSRSFTYDSFCQFSNQIVSDVAQQEESLLGISMSDASRRHASHLLLVTRFVSKSH